VRDYFWTNTFKRGFELENTFGSTKNGQFYLSQRRNVVHFKRMYIVLS
jgi:hypothetical protein